MAVSGQVRAYMGRRAFRGPYAAPYADQTLYRQFRGSMDEILANLNAWIRHMHIQSPHIAEEALRPTFEKSQVYCPIDSGELKDSGYLESRLFRGNAIAEIGYARNGSPDYAIYVHERTDVKHAAPTRAKFLQDAMEEDLSSIRGRVASLAVAASGTGGT